jgi:hypothetical protein
MIDYMIAHGITIITENGRARASGNETNEGDKNNTMQAMVVQKFVLSVGCKDGPDNVSTTAPGST